VSARRPLALALFAGELLLATAAFAQTRELPVAPADLSRLSPAAFRDDELRIPYHLTHFHRLANSVALTGPRRGFIDIAVWRAPKDNQPYNARIMENILSLAYFYTAERPWNPYRGDPAVRARLEAALDFWTRSQSDDGRFSEYAPSQWSLAPTAFATKFMGEALRLLHDGPPIDSALHRRAIDADRRAILAVLTRADMYEHGRRYTNQYGNVWGGALAYLALYPDAEIERLLRERWQQTLADHQSPAGYFYEADGPDWGYDLNTHHSDFHMAWQYARGTAMARGLVEATRRWYEWLGYGAVPEPTGTALTLNRAIETRQRRGVVAEAGPEESEAGNPLASEVPSARVLGPTTEELARRRAVRRAELVRRWPHVDSLPVGSFGAFSPYAFLHRSHVRWSPSDQQRRTAVAAMRHQTENRFTHQRVDSRRTLALTYVRRPGYYAAFNAGEIITPQQRYGLGLVWVPGAGTLLQSQTAGSATAWGTRRADTTLVYEAGSIAPTYRVEGREVTPSAGNRDLPPGELRVEYALGSHGRKRITFGEREIAVAVEHYSSFVEQLPLLVSDTDSVSTHPGRLELRRGPARMVVRWSPESEASVERTEERAGERRVVSVAIPGRGRLRYSIEMQQ
jgi:hypothetical protein